MEDSSLCFFVTVAGKPSTQQQQKPGSAPLLTTRRLQQLGNTALEAALTISRPGPNLGAPRPLEQRQQVAEHITQRLEKELPDAAHTSLCVNLAQDLFEWARSMVGPDQQAGGTLGRDMHAYINLVAMACAGPRVVAARQLGQLAAHLPCSRKFVAGAAQRRQQWHLSQGFYMPRAPAPNAIRKVRTASGCVGICYLEIRS